MDLLGHLCARLRFADAVIYLDGPIPEESSAFRVGASKPVLSHLCESVGVVGVRVFAFVSSAAVYVAAPVGARGRREWPTPGATSCLGARQAADSERLIGRFEGDHPLIRVVGLRPGIIVCPLPPTNRRRTLLLKRLFVPVNGRRWGPLVPNVEPLSIQCVHISDLIEALCLVLTRSVNGTFNVAAEPITSELLRGAYRSQGVSDPAPPFLESFDSRGPPGSRTPVRQSGRTLGEHAGHRYDEGAA